MIGDTLFDCGESLDWYLSRYEWPAHVADRVQRLREEIRSVQKWIDDGGAEGFGIVAVRESPVDGGLSIAEWLANAARSAPHRHR